MTPTHRHWRMERNGAAGRYDHSRGPVYPVDCSEDRCEATTCLEQRTLQAELAAARRPKAVTR